jgi:hypothetical protein
VLQHQAAFIDVLRSGRAVRKRVFDTIEQRHAHDFKNSRVGPGLYEDLLSAVREAGETEAVKEFESRFFPLVNSDPSLDNAAIDSSEKMTARRGSWGAISALFVVAFLGALIVGFNALKITAAEATRSSAKTTASETMPEPTQAEAAEPPIAATKTIEPTSE